LTSKSALRVVLVLVPVVVLAATAPMIGSQKEFFVWLPGMVVLIAVAVGIHLIVERRRRRD
jgi:hypothetical protein